MSKASRRLRAEKAAASAATPLAVPAVVDMTQAAPTRWSSYRPVEMGSQLKGLTPQRIAEYLEAADQGDPTQMAELLQQVEGRDTHMVSVFGTRKRSVANLKWHLEPADESVEARAIKNITTAAMLRIDAIEQGMIDLLDAISKGYAGVEIDWILRGSVVQRVEPQKLQFRPAHWFLPSPDDPEVWHIRDAADPVRGVPLMPNKWVVHVARAMSGWPVQAGLGRALVWWYLYKNYGIKDWVTYGEKFGSPFRLGKYPVGANAADIDGLSRALRQLGVDASAAIPSDMSVEFIGDSAPTRGPDVFERLLVFANREISKCVLGQTLTTEEGATGSLALGAVHNSVRADLRDTDAMQLGRTLTRDLLRPYVLFNFGGRAAESLVPRWIFETEPPADRSAEADVQTKRGAVFKAAVELGVPVALSQVREELGIRVVEAGEAVLTRAAPMSPMAASGAPRPFENLPPGYRIVGAGRITHSPVEQLDASMASYRGAVAAAWRELVGILRRELAGAKSAAAARDAIPAALERVNLDVYADPLAEAMLTAQALGLLQAKANDSREVEALPSGSPFDAERWASALDFDAATWASRVANARTKAAESIRYALLATARDYVAAFVKAEADDALDDAARAEAALEKLDSAATDVRRTESVVEGATTPAWAEGRFEALSQDPNRPYYRYNTMKDKKVRPAHKAMEARVYPADHPIWKVWRPPNGFGCRCWLTAHTFKEVQEAGWDVMDSYPALPEGLPAVPDAGWTGPRTAEPHDLSEFPEDWRTVLEAKKAEYEKKIAAYKEKGGSR